MEKLFQEFSIPSPRLRNRIVVPPMTLPPGCNVSSAQANREKVGIPVLVAGRINEPELAELILQEGKGGRTFSRNHEAAVLPWIAAG